jgi:hypothetical protein
MNNDPHPTPPVNLNVQVNLPASLAKLQIKLQRLVDLPSVGIIGVRKVDESEYQAGPFKESFQIASDGRVPFPEVKEEFVDWCLKNSFTEAIDCMNAFLEECRLLAAMFRLGSGTAAVGQWDRIWNEEKTDFHWKGFPKKIKILREEFRIQSDFENHVLTLNQARNCLVHRLGTVGSEDITEGGKLVVKWFAIRTLVIDKVTLVETPIAEQEEPTKNESNVVSRIGLFEKRFAIGERIRLSPSELAYTMYTFYRFALELLQVIERMIPAFPK